MFKNLIDLLNPKGGRGVLESIIGIILIVAIIYMNIQEIEVNKTIEAISYLLFGYLWGNRPKSEKRQEDE